MSYDPTLDARMRALEKRVCSLENRSGEPGCVGIFLLFVLIITTVPPFVRGAWRDDPPDTGLVHDIRQGAQALRAFWYEAVRDEVQTMREAYEAERAYADEHDGE